MKKVYRLLFTTITKDRYHFFFSVAKDSHDDLPIHEFALRDPLLFGDYRNTCNLGEPRFYEDLLDYEAIFFLFQEVLNYFFVLFFLNYFGFFEGA